MAQETIRYCDFDKPKRGGGTAKCGVKIEDGEPTVFDFESVRYEADLCDEHKAALFEAMRPFTTISRESKIVPRQPRTGRGRLLHKSSRGGAFTSKDVRLWLAEQGREVAPVGRIPNTLIEEYKEAHSV